MVEVAALQVKASADGVAETGRALDGLTKSADGAEKASGRLRGEGAQLSRSGREVAASQQQVAQRVRTTEGSFARLSQSIRGGVVGAFTRLASAAGSVAGQLVAMAAAAFGLRAIFNTLSSFEHSMAGVQAVTRATTADMAEMRAMAAQLGATTEFTASQAAEGLRFLGMAGFSTRDSLAAIPAVLDLATAASMELGAAADISSNMMSAFGIAAAEAGRVADVLAAAASRANTDIYQMGDGMKYVGPVAGALGISINDVAAAIGTLSDAGIQGSMAGTGLRRVLSSLANPTRQAAEALRSLGVNLREVNPATNSIAEIVQRLADSGMNAAQALTIFGDRGGPAILALVENNAKLQDLTRTLRSVEGEAARMANTMRDNLKGDFDMLKAAVEAVVLALGEAGLTAVLRAAVQLLTALTSAIAAAVNGISSAVSFIVRLSSGTYEAERATTQLNAAIATEIARLRELTGEMQPGITMSRDTALAKLAEAEARLANVNAMRQEAAMQSREYQAIAAEIAAMERTLNSNLRRLWEDIGQGDTSAYIEIISENLDRLNELQGRLSQMVGDATGVATAEVVALQAEIEALRRIIEGASGDMVTFTAETGAAGTAATDLSDRATRSALQWAMAMGSVRSEIQGILSALSTLTGGMIDQASMRAQLEALRAGRSVADARRVGIETREDLELSGRQHQLRQRFGSHIGGMMGGALAHELGERRELRRTLEREYELRTEAERAAERAGRSGARASEREAKAIRDVIEGLEAEIELVNASAQARRLHQALQQAGVELYSVEGQRIADLVEQLSELERVRDHANAGREAITNLFMALGQGSDAAKRAIAQLLAEMARVQMMRAMLGLQQGGMGGFFGLLGRLLTPPTMNAMGNVYTSPSLSAYSGGVYDTPQVFAFANGGVPRAGVFGEAGPEAIMPLKRGRDGKLGVAAEGGAGGGSTRVLVELSPELVGQILEQAGQQSVQITQAGVKQYDRALPGRFSEIQSKPRYR